LAGINLDDQAAQKKSSLQ